MAMTFLFAAKNESRDIYRGFERNLLSYFIALVPCSDPALPPRMESNSG
jgi:hypothetical protein